MQSFTDISKEKKCDTGISGFLKKEDKRQAVVPLKLDIKTTYDQITPH